MKIKNWTACVQDREKLKKEVVEKAKTISSWRKFSAWKKKKKKKKKTKEEEEENKKKNKKVIDELCRQLVVVGNKFHAVLPNTKAIVRGIDGSTSLHIIFLLDSEDSL